MYGQKLQICLLGRDARLWSRVRSISPLPDFNHNFSQSCEILPERLADADAIFADLRECDAQGALKRLMAGRKPGAQILLLASSEQAPGLAARADPHTDIWLLPMSDAMLDFRLTRWQRELAVARDCWLAQHMLDASLSNSPNLIWFKDSSGRHIKVNDSFAQAAGMPRELIEGKLHHEIWGGDANEDCSRSEEQVMTLNRPGIFEETVQCGGRSLKLTTYKATLHDNAGKVMGTVGMSMDRSPYLANRREIEQQGRIIRSQSQELEEQGRLLETLFASMGCGMICHSLDGRKVLSINQAALSLLGYEDGLPEDCFDMIWDAVLEEDRQTLRECLGRLQKPGDSASLEYRVRHRDGEILHILSNAKLVQDGGQTFYQRFLVDITERKRREEHQLALRDEALEDKSRRFELFSNFLSDNVDDIYIMMSGDGSAVEFITPNVERLLAISPGAALANVRALGKPRYLAGQGPEIEDLKNLSEDSPYTGMETTRIHRKTGEERRFLESVYAVQVQGVKKIVVYISDRTREWQNRQALSQALEMAQMASRAKSAFLSSVSHDIRTPMNTITGFVTLLQEEAWNPENVRHYTEKISLAIQHLVGLIDNVLDMNRIESGAAVLSISEFSLAELVDEIYTIIRPQARARSQNFEIFAHSLPCEYVLGDRLRISQILLNILSNAVKYTQDGGEIKMTVEALSQVDRKYSRIRFTIRDNGRGMSEEYQKVIFDPFSREAAAGAGQVQGTGLGMAITRSLVDLMHGSIAVSSQPGRGSTFTVELELRTRENEDSRRFWQEHQVRRILMVDDDQDICRDIVRKMSGTGVTVDCAGTPSEVIRLLRHAENSGKRYDLVILDWKMPEMDGVEMGRLIGENTVAPVPVILFTAYDWAEIREEARQAGIHTFLSKPFFMSNFKGAVEQALGRARKVKQAGEASGALLAGRRALVVDDINVNRMILVRILTTLGAVCEEAENGQEALEKFIASPTGHYDFVLMDVKMPVMDGHEASRAMRASAHPQAADIPIIAMTANAFVEDMRAALDAGMNAHLGKPLMLDQLEKTLRQTLGGD